MTDSQKLTVIAKIIRTRFTLISVNDALALAEEIMRKIND